MRELRIGEDVLSRAGERLGHLERIVVDQASHRVTHLVAGGRVLSVSGVQDAGPKGLVTRLDRAGFEREPVFESSRFDAPGEHWQAPAGFRLEHFLGLAGAIIGTGPYLPPTQVELDPLPRAHEITGGSPVWAGEVRLGEVDRVLTDDAGWMTGIVLRREGLRRERVVIPAGRVLEVVGNNLHVDLDEPSLDSLERFEG